MKKKIITFLLFSVMIFSVGYAETSKGAQKLIDAYALQRHSEGGWFAEIYTSPFKAGGRSTRAAYISSWIKPTFRIFTKLIAMKYGTITRAWV
ncbi:MAG: hypothetical protein J6I62_10390 [Selenomonadaceae bacterium]|nr:hypothetical protein [Selenomonadaceae bacterium]